MRASGSENGGFVVRPLESGGPTTRYPKRIFFIDRFLRFTYIEGNNDPTNTFI